MTARIALQVNAAIGVLATAVAAAAMWLVLTRPAEIVASVSAREYGPMAAAIGHQLLVWTRALLDLL